MSTCLPVPAFSQASAFPVVDGNVLDSKCSRPGSSPARVGLFVREGKTNASGFRCALLRMRDLPFGTLQHIRLLFVPQVIFVV
ncbi:hypothetical protein PoB_004336800 [Plakobranchus ocellatus]|uniref:Secreted protein n=1 Tax=Plakobranchus ocellatus TaxID=259542 RepID=A0AAV4BCH2_9GAST|nr:hypothetical protein PoB_004336800 [Plakobranchus ocellatus]